MSDSPSSPSSGQQQQQQQSAESNSNASPSGSPRMPIALFNAPPKTGQWTQWISRLLNNETANAVMNMNELQTLCNQAKEVLSAEPNMIPVNVSKDDKLVLVGDVHGQFRDMQTHVLSLQFNGKTKLAERDKKFLFLGDYVDRGPQGVETIALLLCLKIEYPELVFMLRGNHEEAQTCRIYGFLQECRSKLQISAWQMFNEVFQSIPLAAVVCTCSGNFFCAHGGLSPRLDCLETLQFITRSEYGTELTFGQNSEIIDGLLWSDPAEHQGFRPNLRGCGFTFGPDTSEKFCIANELQFICRAHQMCQAGYRWDHNDKVLTLFSAPNYCGINGNQAAIAIVDGSQEQAPVKLEFIVFDASTEKCELFSGDIDIMDCPGSPVYPPSTAANHMVKTYFQEGEGAGGGAAGGAAAANDDKTTNQVKEDPKPVDNVEKNDKSGEQQEVSSEGQTSTETN